MANTYDLIDLVRVTGTFTNASGTAVDPDVVTIYYRDPSGNQSSDVAPTNPSVGVYYTDISIDESGEWQYRIQGETAGGGYQGGGEGSFYVRSTYFTSIT